MKDFLAGIKHINTDWVIFEFSKALSICFSVNNTKSILPLYRLDSAYKKNVSVPPSAWDVQDIAYLAVLHSNDYRRERNSHR